MIIFIALAMFFNIAIIKFVNKHCTRHVFDMSLIQKVESWGDHHHPAMLDMIRIVLGIFLLLKGCAFMQHTGYLTAILQQQEWITLEPFMLTIIIDYVIFVHIAGGVLITLGILTRLSCLLQLPVIAAAVFMINLFQSSLNSDMWLTLITCFLLIIFMITGSGPLSLDRYLKNTI